MQALVGSKRFDYFLFHVLVSVKSCEEGEYVDGLLYERVRETETRV